MRCSLLAPLVWLAACGGHDGSVSVEVNSTGCSPACAVDTYQIFLLRQGAAGACIFRDAAAGGAPPGEVRLDALDLAPGERFGVSVLGSCGESPCARCAGTGETTVQDQISLVVNLTGAARCDPVPGTACAPRRLWLRAVDGTRVGRMAVDATVHARDSISGQPVFPDLNQYNHLGTIVETDAATYTVELTESWNWFLWARLLYPGNTTQPTNDPNSFWITVDGRPRLLLGNRLDQDGLWHWDGQERGRLPLGRLEVGRHRLKLFNREARETASVHLSPRLDLLLLTNDPAFHPTLLGKMSAGADCATGSISGKPVFGLLCSSPSGIVTSAGR